MKEFKRVEKTAEYKMRGAKSIFRMSYSTQEPDAVNFTFYNSSQDNEGIEWIFGRELLDKGLQTQNGQEAGEGDVKISKRDNTSIINLDSPFGKAFLTVNTIDLVNFVEDTKKIVPMGKEEQWYEYDFDKEIAEILPPNK